MPESTADILVITALPMELDALLAAGNGLRGEWEPYSDAEPFRYHVCNFTGAGEQQLRFAAAHALEMGEVFAAACAVRLIHHLNPKILAMCGVCAGRRGEVLLGDVIVADRLFKFDSGAAVSSEAGANEYSVRLYGDVRTYDLHSDWKLAIG
jgi:nucleoside phosphorylase